MSIINIYCRLIFGDNVESTDDIRYQEISTNVFSPLVIYALLLSLIKKKHNFTGLCITGIGRCGRKEIC